jgi:hypothetical protein
MGTERDSYVLEKIGGPGRTRTCDNTVMSGQPRGRKLRDPECY